MDKLKLPIGVESFEEIVTKGWYYVDKTGFIKNLVDFGGKVNLFTRPRRFGKSLTNPYMEFGVLTGGLRVYRSGSKGNVVIL